jgi:hypothetical protein
MVGQQQGNNSHQLRILMMTFHFEQGNFERNFEVIK